MIEYPLNEYLHILPMLQGEKFCSPVWATGDMRNWPPASQELALNGQHGGLFAHPSEVHCTFQLIRCNNMITEHWRHAGERCQSFACLIHEKSLTMAPKLWPVSWATTCHSVLPDVDTAVPDTDSPCWLLEALWLHLKKSQCENERVNLNYSQCPEPSNTNFSASRTTTHQMPQSCTIIPLLTSPLWKKRETFFQRNISAADIPRDSRIRSCRTSVNFFICVLLMRHQIAYPRSWTARCRIPKLILKVFCQDFRYNQLERDQNRPCIMYLPY